MTRPERTRRGSRSEAAPYQEFLDRLHGRLRAAPSTTRDVPLPIASELPGVFPLVDSLASAAILEVDAEKRTTVREWNAFSQRVFLLSAAELRDEALTRELDRAADAVDRFIDLCHQASHLLLLEPFFVGRWGAPTKAQFVASSLVFEGFCFWIADIVVTRRLRVRLSDGELVRNRSAISQSRFHPYRAFEALGLRDDRAILDVYLRAFAGERTALDRKRHATFVRDLSLRFARFHAGSQVAVPDLFRELVHQDVFGEFRRRFCAVPGLPTLLPEEILRIDGNVSPRELCLAVAEKGLPGIEALPDDVLPRVRARRALQTRAYSAFTLRAALRDEELMTPDGKKAPWAGRDGVLRNVEAYLDQLETAIRALATGGSLRHASAMRAEADASYTERIQRPLAEASLWMARRKLVLPYLKPAFGLLPASPRLPAKARTDLTRHLVRLATETYVGEPRLTAVRTNVGLERLAAVMSTAAKLGDGRAEPRREAAWACAVNALVCEPELLPKWSVRLGSVDPARNYFRELRFSIV